MKPLSESGDGFLVVCREEVLLRKLNPLAPRCIENDLLPVGLDKASLLIALNRAHRDSRGAMHGADASELFNDAFRLSHGGHYTHLRFGVKHISVQDECVRIGVQC